MSLPVRLSGIRLQISAGEQVALRGPSGSGKTTLLNIIAGLTRPHTGTVFVGSMAVHELSESGQRRLRRKSIGLVFQSGALIPHLTVIENVLLGQRLLHPFRRMSSFVPRARQLLASVGLESFAGRMPDQLSAGEQQRVALCRALLPQPGLLLADEPTANLDEDTARIVATVLLQESTRLGITVLCATHDPVLLGMMKRQVQLRAGEVVA
jgi:putative ABC transport system ATP-binding protein